MANVYGNCHVSTTQFQYFQKRPVPKTWPCKLRSANWMSTNSRVYSISYLFFVKNLLEYDLKKCWNMLERKKFLTNYLVMLNALYPVHTIFTQSFAEISERTSYDKLMYLTWKRVLPLSMTSLLFLSTSKSLVSSCFKC